jgi:hypothetical protein
MSKDGSVVFSKKAAEETISIIQSLYEANICSVAVYDIHAYRFDVLLGSTQKAGERCGLAAHHAA